MCQVDEEYNGQLERRDGPSVSKKCVKCKEATAAVVIRVGDAFCRGCFKDYFIHKFRAMLGKNRLIFPGEKVLLAVSGGPASCSMLNQVQEGLSHQAPKKLRFTPGIVHIDDGGAIGLSSEERQRTVAELESIFKATGYPYHIVPLEQVLNLPSSVLEPGSGKQTTEMNYKAAVDQFIATHHSPCTRPNSDDHADLSALSIQEEGHTPVLIDGALTQSLQRLFDSVKTLTAKEELLHTLRQHLLVHTARRQGYSKLMLGESCTRLAVKLLASISLGRGAQLAMDTGFSDPRYGDIVVVRPMRDYSAKEISFYNHIFHIPSVFIPALDTKTTDKASIQRLTESFVTKLQADFPSTVSTIYRTSEKLQTACSSQTSPTKPSDKCLLCLCALDTTVEEASAFQATLISEKLSQRTISTPGSASVGPPVPDSVLRGTLAPTPVLQEECCSSGGKQGRGGGCGGQGEGVGCCSTIKYPKTVELKTLLCYSCRLNIKDMASVDVLPDYILSEAERRNRRSQMKEEISDFLLGDDDDEEEEDDEETRPLRV